MTDNICGLYSNDQAKWLLLYYPLFCSIFAKVYQAEISTIPILQLEDSLDDDK